MGEERFRGEKLIQGVLVALSLAAVIFVAIGYFAEETYADIFDWWQRSSFVMNLASALTGALIGLPFVIFILRRIQNSQNEQDDRRQTERLRDISFARLATVLRPADYHWWRYVDVGRAFLCLVEARDQLAQQKDVYIQTTTYSKIPEVQDIFIDEAVAELRRRRTELRDAFSSAQGWLEVALGKAANFIGQTPTLAYQRWIFLDTHVRPRVMEAGIPWIEGPISTELEILLGDRFDFSAIKFVLREEIFAEYSRYLEELSVRNGSVAYINHAPPNIELHLDRCAFELLTILRLSQIAEILMDLGDVGALSDAMLEELAETTVLRLPRK